MKKTTTKKPAEQVKKNPAKSKSKKSKTTLKPEVLQEEKLDPNIDDLDAKALAPTEESVPNLDALQKYLSEVRKYPLISAEEEHRLAVIYKETGDRKAAEALVTANLRFVVKVAAEYSKFGARMIDLIQEGNVGLMHAVREFNPYKGIKLITYAVWWIRGYIQEYLMKNYSQVRIGTTQAQKKLFYHLNKEKAKLDALGNAPDVKLLSSRLGVTENDVIEMEKRMSGRDLSLDTPQGDDDSGSRWIDTQSDQNATSIDDVLALSEEKKIFYREIEKIVLELNEKEKYLLQFRVLGDPPQTLQEVGDHFKITRERARQLEERLIEKIKEHFQKVMPDYQINLPKD
ncbi:MAG: RNA polymerase factor sigma-32 [Oligoflexia bacterium]|nr:RNA polymerase factor sigma-32 [Oligoflexia bacterium]